MEFQESTTQVWRPSQRNGDQHSKRWSHRNEQYGAKPSPHQSKTTKISFTHTHPTLHPTPQNLRSPSPVLSASLCLGLSTPAPGYPGSPTVGTAQQVQGHWFQHQTESRQLFSSTQDSSRQCLKLCSNFHLQQLKTVWSVWSPVVSSRYNTEWNYVP